MKIPLNKLTPERYYHSYVEIYKNHFYFKYNKHNDLFIYYTYSFIKDINGISCYFLTNSIFSIDWYNNVCLFSEEVAIENIVKYLPNNNPDKVIYIRQQRIKYLLREI